MKEDYSELDAAILELIKSGRNSFPVLSNGLADKRHGRTARKAKVRLDRQSGA